ncbi:T9SS type A sorting domain-containing protein [Winogradskyella sp. 4-2091]|uniref:T9SS type A sorting domain-containing protein n=1 Tax=Winogradskyella sp. 4-2091 TaxID=3381659 RepID=UPI003892C1B5
MKTKLLYTPLLFGVLFLNFSFSQQTFIPDDVFEQYLIDEGYDTVLDDYVLTNNINTVTTIDLGAKGVSDLTGLQNFTDLITLDVSENALLNSLDISNNSALVNLNAWNTSISSLNLVNNTALMYLNIYNTSISNIDVSNNTSLDYISVANTNIVNIDLSNNTILNYLNVSDSNLNNLDVSANSVLNILIANNMTNLQCITVIDESAANAGTNIYEDWVKDASISYSESCTLSDSEFESYKVYVGPNPMKNQLNIELYNSSIINDIVLFDITGKQILKTTKTQIFTSQLQSGIYLIRISTNNGIVTKKLIKD